LSSIFGGRMTLATAQTIRAIRSNILAIGLNRIRRTSPASFSIAVDNRDGVATEALAHDIKAAGQRSISESPSGITRR